MVKGTGADYAATRSLLYMYLGEETVMMFDVWRRTTGCEFDLDIIKFAAWLGEARVRSDVVSAIHEILGGLKPMKENASDSDLLGEERARNGILILLGRYGFLQDGPMTLKQLSAADLVFQTDEDGVKKRVTPKGALATILRRISQRHKAKFGPLLEVFRGFSAGP